VLRSVSNVMTDTPVNVRYPRSLTVREREWIEWILPVGRPAYNQYRDLIHSMLVIGQGRRGEGEMILGKRETQIDLESPLPAVFAYGAIETNFGTISITVREVQDDQISLEIVSHRADFVPEDFEEFRRWTYSTWSPGDHCPQCTKPVREVLMHTEAGEHFVLALCTVDKRLWVYDETSKVNRLIPMTNYYNELMLHKNIRDPKVALDSKRLFSDLVQFSDEDLTYAFLTYNKIHTKVRMKGMLESDAKKRPSFIQRLSQLFNK